MDTIRSTLSPHLKSALNSPPKCHICCSSENLRRCSNCKAAFYCSREHQQSDWRNHKMECKSIRNQIDSAAQLHQSQQIFQNTAHPSQSNFYPDNVLATPAQPFEGAAAGGWPQPNLSDMTSTSGQPAFLPYSRLNNGIDDAAMGHQPPMTMDGGRDSGASFQQAAAQLQADREKKVRDFRNLTENTMRINDVHLTNAANVMAR